MDTARSVIVGLLEHIGKGIDDGNSLPTQEVLGELQDVNKFKYKNLETAKKTMESLTAELKKREKELELLKTSEPKLIKELNHLKESITKMKKEIQEYQDIDGLRKRYEQTQEDLSDLSKNYARRRDTMRSQVQSISADNEALKRNLNNNETHKELEETEKRLKGNERTIFELKEFVDTKTRETNYEGLKINCLRIVDALNTVSIQKSLEVGSNGRK